MGNKVDSDTYITDLQVYTDWYHAVVHWFEIISLRIVFYCKYKRIARVRQCVRDELRPAVHGHSGPRIPHGPTDTDWYYAVVHWVEILSLRIVFYC